MKDPFLGPKLKIKRAEAHIQEFRAAGEAFRESNPYEGFVEEDHEAGQVHFKLRILKPIPDDFPLVIGDAIQNLRTSLDYAACCLALQNNPTVNINNVSFPIARDVKEFEAAAKKRIKKLAPEAIAFIRALKPYKGGNDQFWELHRLGVRDRHRLLVTTWAGRGAAGFRFIPPSNFNLTPEEIKEIPHIMINPRDRLEPLEDGSPLLTISRSAVGQTIDNEFKAVVHIALGDGEVIAAEPVLPTLLQLHNFIEGVITSIEKRFFT